MNGPGVAAQLTEGLGAKSGGERLCAAHPVLAAKANAPKLMPPIAANLDMFVPPSCPVYRRSPMM
jgi:hypothetical protein